MLATLASERTEGLIADGATNDAAVNGGYHLAYLIGAALTAVAFVVTLVVVRAAPAAAHGEAMGGEPAYAEPVSSMTATTGGDRMSEPFTHKNLDDVDDSAPKFGFEESQEARFASEDLDARADRIQPPRVKPSKRQGFAHSHDEAEEVYVVLSGSGRVKLDDEIVELVELDALRVAPGVIRQFEAGPDGLELLAFGARHEGDGEIIPGWWTD